MARSLNTGFSVCGSNEAILSCSSKGSLGLCPPFGTLQLTDSRSKEFMGKPLDAVVEKGFSNWNAKSTGHSPVKAQASIFVSRALRWWEKFPKPNMIEIHSAQELVDGLLNAGDKLVVIDFYSPGCGGCRFLHPKVCQLAEAHPDAIFFKVNNQELKTMCHCLHVHVLPFFRLYRGAEGKLCSFSCTNATIKKFKDALAKYGADQYGVGPAKGLNENELLALASAGLIKRNLRPEDTEDKETDDLAFNGLNLTSALSKDEAIAGLKESSTLAMALN